jgi:hypothetical protein
LITDQNDDWDVREAIAGDGSAKLDAFLAERREKQERLQLSQMRRSGAIGLRAAAALRAAPTPRSWQKGDDTNFW